MWTNNIIESNSTNKYRHIIEMFDFFPFFYLMWLDAPLEIRRHTWIVCICSRFSHLLASFSIHRQIYIRMANFIIYEMYIIVVSWNIHSTYLQLWVYRRICYIIYLHDGTYIKTVYFEELFGWSNSTLHKFTWKHKHTHTGK